jgi:iron complex outermembrane receptor protein
MSHKPVSNVRALALTIAALSMGAPVAWAAEGGIEEVTVTAQKREENLQSTPIAISALSADTLEKMGVSDFTDVAKASPSIHFTTYPSSNMLTLYMRGQGINDPMQITADGSVGLYQDGFYVGRPLGAIFELADLERVEVLRGPQGTLYGRNTTGGAVNMIAKRPTGEFGFKQSFTVGTRDLFRSLTTIDLPAWNDVATKVTILKSSQDGLVKNTGNSHDFGESEQLSGRFDLHWNVNDALAADYFFETGELNSTPLYFQNEQVQQSGRVAGYTKADTRRGTTYRDIDLPEGTSRFENHGLTLAWDISDAFTVKSLTGYRELTVDGYQDYAEALGTAVSTNAINAYDAIQSYTFSQEFQFIGNALDDRIRYVSGLYYYRDSASHYQDFFTGINATPSYTSSVDKLRDVSAEAQSLAAYGQVTWRPPVLDDRFEATLGARYTRDKREAERKLLTSIGSGPLFGGGTITVPGSTERGIKNDQDFNRFNPALTLNYNWSDDLSTYAKVSTGYRAGGSSEAAPVGAFDLTYGPEKIVAYEAGMKSYWLDRRVRFNSAAFVSKIDDMQMLIATSPSDSSVVQGFNAGKSTIEGVEFDLLVQPIDDLSLGLNYAYLHPKFDSVKAPAGTIFDSASNPRSPYAAGDDIKDLFVVPNAPRHSVTASADYTLWRFAASDISTHFDYRWQSHMYTSALGGSDVPDQVDVGVGAYGILNGKFTWAFDLPRGDHAKLSLWGKNLTNQYYAAQVIGLGGGPVDVAAAPPGNTAGRKAIAEAWSEPPSYGVEVVYEY